MLKRGERFVAKSEIIDSYKYIYILEVEGEEGEAKQEEQRESSLNEYPLIEIVAEWI